MFCGKCGRELSEKAKFCEYCGERIQNGDAELKNQVRPSILSNLLGIAVSIGCICFSFFYFNLSAETRSNEKSSELASYGMVFLGVGLLIGIIAINSWYRKKR